MSLKEPVACFVSKRRVHLPFRNLVPLLGQRPGDCDLLDPARTELRVAEQAIGKLVILRSDLKVFLDETLDPDWLRLFRMRIPHQIGQ